MAGARLHWGLPSSFAATRFSAATFAMIFSTVSAFVFADRNSPLTYLPSSSFSAFTTLTPLPEARTTSFPSGTVTPECVMSYTTSVVSPALLLFEV